MQHGEAIALARALGEQFATRAEAADRSSILPTADVQALKGSGYLAMNVPKEYGGLNLSLRTCVEAQLELAKGSASTAVVSAMQLQVMGEARLTRPSAKKQHPVLCSLIHSLLSLKSAAPRADASLLRPSSIAQTVSCSTDAKRGARVEPI